MPRPPAPLPPELGPHFRSDRALAVGVSRGRLRAADLVTPFRGTRTRLSAPPMPGEGHPYPRDELARVAIIDRARALSLVLPEHAFYTGQTALALQGMELLDAERAASADLEVAVFAPHRALRRPGIHSLQVQPGLANVRLVDGLLVATPATAWAMCARDMGERDLIKVGDVVVRVPRDDRGRRRADLQRATPAQLRAAIEAGPRRGAGRLRTALERVSEHSMSMLETDWRENLRGTDLPAPELDYEVRDQRGILLGIADGAFVTARVVVEVEGDHHCSSRRQWLRDIDKHAAYAAAGWELVRLTSAHIRPQRGRDVEVLRLALERRGWRAPAAR